MNCNKISCYFTRKKFENKKFNRMEDLEPQLDKCNSCVIRKEVSDVADKTRNIIGTEYVSQYWKNHAK